LTEEVEVKIFNDCELETVTNVEPMVLKLGVLGCMAEDREIAEVEHTANDH